MKFVIFLALFLTAQVSSAQTTFKIVVKDEATREPIVGAIVTVKDISISVNTDFQFLAQLLKDRFPAFGGFSGSISLLDILPRQDSILKSLPTVMLGALPQKSGSSLGRY